MGVCMYVCARVYAIVDGMLRRVASKVITFPSFQGIHGV